MNPRILLIPLEIELFARFQPLFPIWRNFTTLHPNNRATRFTRSYDFQIKIVQFHQETTNTSYSKEKSLTFRHCEGTTQELTKIEAGRTDHSKKVRIIPEPLATTQEGREDSQIILSHEEPYCETIRTHF